MFEPHLRIPVEVDTRGAEGLVSGVLLDRWLRPSSEGLEVTEVGRTVVVGVPERSGGSASPVQADDGLPVVVVGIHSWVASLVADLAQHVGNEVTVGLQVGRPVVSLNVDPDHAIRYASQAVDQSLDLASRVTARYAREQVDVNVLDTSRFSIAHVGS